MRIVDEHSEEEGFVTIGTRSTAFGERSQLGHAPATVEYRLPVE